MKIKDLKNQKGFTIIETLVAITILMISIAGPLTIAQKSLMAAIYAKDQVIASYLAQDLMEDIKNNRDNYILSNGLGSLPTWVYPAVCGQLNIQNDGTYGCGSGTPSRFTRTFLITPISSSEKEVVVTVSWQNGTVQNSTILENHFFDLTL